MAGSIDGGKRAAATNKKLYGSDYYNRIGALGGKVGRTGGFYADRERASKAGKLGGIISRRKNKLTPQEIKQLKEEYGN